MSSLRTSPARNLAAADVNNTEVITADAMQDGSPGRCGQPLRRYRRHRARCRRTTSASSASSKSAAACS